MSDQGLDINNDNMFMITQVSLHCQGNAVSGVS